MIKEFSFAVPGEVMFGVGIVSKSGEKLKAAGINKALLVSDRVLESIGTVQKLEDILKDAGIEYEKFLDVEANPSIETVMAATKVYKDNALESIICLGGGSPIDVGKTVAVMSVNPGSPADYEYIDKFQGTLPPIVAIPTTAGTGSEVTASAVVTKKLKNYKLSIVSNRLIPKLTVLDPMLITSLPPQVAAATGMDALTHAVETYLSTYSSLFTDAMAEKAMELIGKYLRRFVANRTDIEAASGMLLASDFAGIAFSLGRLGVSHAMAHPLGGYYNVPHGVANSILLPYALEYNKNAQKEERYLKIYQYIKECSGPVIHFIPEMLIDEVHRLSSDLGLPQTLSEVGVDDKLIKEMAIDAMKTGNHFSNPRSVTVDDVAKLLKKAL